MAPTPSNSPIAAAGLTGNTDLDLGLECHFNWVEKDSISQEVFESIQTGSDLWFQNTQNDQFIRFSYKIDHFFEKAVLAHWEDKNEEAARFLDQAEVVLESFESEIPLYHGQAFRYLLRANRAVLEYRRMGHGIEVDEARERALQVNIDDPKTQAMIFCMKAYLVGAFGNREGRVELLREVRKLHPDYPDYMQEFFMALRRLRREVFHLEEPTDEEIENIEEAYRRDEDNPNVLHCMATLYQDIIKATMHSGCSYEPKSEYVKRCLENKANLVLKMQSFARTAYSHNPGSVNLAIRLAEVLCIGRHGNPRNVDSESLSEAEEIYQRCINEFETSSEALHKAGKFYCNMRHEHHRGIDLILDSLEVEPTNFPATMDYLRYNGTNLIKSREGLQEMIDFIDLYLPFNAPRKNLTSKLLATKGALLAKLGNLKKAVDCWIEGITLSPDILKADTVGKLFGKGVFRQLLRDKQCKSILDFVKNEIDEEPLDSVRLTPLKGIEEAIKAELELFATSGTYTAIRKHTYSESELDSDWRSPTCRPTSGLSILESSSTPLSTSAISPPSSETTPSVGVYKCPSRYANDTPSIGWGSAGGQKRNDRMARSYDYEPIATPDWREFETNKGRQARRNFGLQDNLLDSSTTSRDSPNYWSNGNSGFRAEFGTRTQENTNRRPRSSYETQQADLDDNWRR